LETLFRRSSVFWQLAIEKLPLVLLSVIFCAVTFWTQTVAREANETLPLGERLANALVSYVAYLGQLVYPVGLAIFYPHPGANLPLGKVLVAVVVFMLVSSGVLACRRRCPYLLMGWLWYLVMLAPVIGVVQAGWQAMADRFTYLPQIGLCIAMAWGAADLLRCCSYRGWLGSGAVALVLAVLMGCAWRQTCFWRDSEILWTHALTCTLRNDTAHSKLGMALADSGRHDAAISQYRKALAIKADNAEVHSNLSVALGAQGRLDDAMMHAQEALRVDPRSAGAHFNLALILSCRGRLDEAIVHYQQGLETEPGDARAHCYLGAALAKRERFDESAAQFEQAVRLKPDDVDAQVQLAWLRATCPEVSLRNGAAAIEHARRARQLCSSPRLDVFNTLAAAYAEAGQFPEAVAAARQALELAEQHRAWALANSLRSRIAQYEAGSP
jgi:tetratricopeptide (TPR) repeat protein